MTIRVSGPRVPGSEHIPFSPINAHGRKARMPDGWKSPMREPLYQVHIEDSRHGHIRIGPKVRIDVASQLCAAVQTAIKSGKITGWSSPAVLPAPPERVTGPAPDMPSLIQPSLISPFSLVS